MKIDPASIHFGSNEPTEMIDLELPQPMRDFVIAMAMRDGITVSEWVNRLIDKDRERFEERERQK